MTHPLTAATVRELLLCPACRAGGLGTVAFERDGESLVHGVLACSSCGRWYRVEDGLPELLVPPLRDESRAAAFVERFRGRWDGWGVKADGSAADEGTALKLDQIGFFREEAVRYDRGITDSAFWRAFDEGFLEAIDDSCRGRDVAVEVGAGTGRLLRRLSLRFPTVIAADLCEEMLRESMRKLASGLPAEGSVLHVVADAERLPIRDGVASCAVFSGVLSYLGAPARAVSEAVRVLRPGGAVVGQENNRSAFRPAFDALMGLRRSWRRKSWPPRGTVGTAVLSGWLNSSGVVARTWTEVFLPPHAFNALPLAGARRLMRATNSLAAALPWLRAQGGLVLFAGSRGAEA